MVLVEGLTTYSWSSEINIVERKLHVAPNAWKMYPSSFKCIIFFILHVTNPWKIQNYKANELCLLCLRLLSL